MEGHDEEITATFEAIRQMIEPLDKSTKRLAFMDRGMAESNNWARASLRELGVELIDCDHRTPPPSEDGYPYVAIPQLHGGRIALSDTRKITRQHFEDWTKRAKPKAYDVVLSRRCNPGETAFVEPGMEFALGQNLVLLRAHGSKVYPPFLRWLVRGPEWWEQIGRFINAGAVFDSLKCADIPNFELSVPPIEEQRSIANTLGALDDKIELNRRMNETLEAMARAIFKSWFIDFDPVRRNMARAAGQNQPSPQSPLPLGEGQGEGVAEGIAFDHLFPDSFVDSPIGKIPKGWRVAPLPEVCEINPPRRLTAGQNAAYLDMQNMPTRGHRPPTWILRSFTSGSRFANGDTLLARITPCLENGKTAYVDFLRDGEVGWGSTEFIVLSPRPPLPAEYAYCLGRDEGFRDFAIQNMTGSSGRQRVPTSCLGQYILPAPPDSIARRFGEIVRPLFAGIKVISEESGSLAAIRDALLPKLISGKIRVNDAENAGVEVR